jgi:hypothetical protein
MPTIGASPRPFARRSPPVEPSSTNTAVMAGADADVGRS